MSMLINMAADNAWQFEIQLPVAKERRVIAKRNFNATRKLGNKNKKNFSKDARKDGVLWKNSARRSTFTVF